MMIIRLRTRRLTLACVAVALIGAELAQGQVLTQRMRPPEEHSLTTKDSVQLKITYYPSNVGQQAVPVIMLHDFNETRAVFDPLARALHYLPMPESPAPQQIESRAVVTVDLRGHGESKTAFAPDGTAMELDATRFRTEDFESMVLYDLEAVRSFLVEQNDAGLLNLNKLCVVGSGMGANVAVLWAARDWATPPLAVRKQGQDVKALALLSPRWNFKGLVLRDAFKFPPIQRQISMLIAYGDEDRAVAKDCDNILKILSRFHPEPPADQVQQRQTLFVYPAATNLQGTKLLTSRAFDMGPKLANFIELRLARKDFPYLQRKKP